MKLIKNLLEHNKLWLFLAIAWTFIVFYFCLTSSSGLPRFPQYFDKVAHFSFHFGITLFWFLYFNSLKLNVSLKKALQKAFLLSLSLGIFIEFLQEALTETRHADVFDVLANTTGALAVYAIVSLIDSKK
ncbi:MAG: VanZ family protein [Flavobacterium sp.]